MFPRQKYLFHTVYFLFLCISSFVFGDTPSLSKPLDPQIFILFGASGDLAHKKIFPALNALHRKGELPKNFACIAFGRSSYSDETFRQSIRNLLGPEATPFVNHIYYVQGNLDEEVAYKNLKNKIHELEKQWKIPANHLYYLATAASLFPTIIPQLKAHKLFYDIKNNSQNWSRVIIEKPLGHSYSSALKLKEIVNQNLDESQIYLIDHYLGKEVIQNLLTFRFSNPLFETLWTRESIESVKITLSEDIGIANRGAFWEETGLLRDLVQNHLMQILSLVAMEKPFTLTSKDIHQEKIRLLKSIRPFPLLNLNSSIIRGQYGTGVIQEKDVPSYRAEKNVSQDSPVETFVAAKLFIDNPRWQDVPFFIIAGKRLKEKLAEIIIKFKPNTQGLSNQLIFRIQPDEEVALIYCSQVPDSDKVQPVKMTFNYKSLLSKPIPDAYERLILQGMLGDRRLFVTFDEALISWKLFDPVLDYWKTQPHPSFPNYSAGSEGPQELQLLLSTP